jgi:hypothetical protein
MLGCLGALGCWLLAFGAAACSHWVTTTEELPAGSCASRAAASGGHCRRGTIDYAAWGGATVTGDARELGGNGGYRWRGFEVALDERRVHRGTDPVDPNGYHSLAGAFDLRLSPTWLVPSVHRYVDVGVLGGFELGAIDFSGVVRGRGSAFWGANLELALPDTPVLGLDFEGNGVPAIHVGIRQTSYVQEWLTATTLEIGLTWRWGTPVDLYTYRYYRMSLD